MTNIRRFYKEGNQYFLTHVTYNRDPILINNIDLFNISFKSLKSQKEFKKIAWVILPDHFHLLIDPLNENLSVL